MTWVIMGVSLEFLPFTAICKQAPIELGFCIFFYRLCLIKQIKEYWSEYCRSCIFACSIWRKQGYCFFTLFTLFSLCLSKAGTGWSFCLLYGPSVSHSQSGVCHMDNWSDKQPVDHLNILQEYRTLRLVTKIGKWNFALSGSYFYSQSLEPQQM